MSRFSPSSGAEPPAGRQLLALAGGVAVGVLLGNLAPPGIRWAWVLVPLALGCGWRGIVRHPAAAPWWAAAGLLAGVAGCALAPQAPLAASEPVAVRVVGSLRDGWRGTPYGWSNRVHVESVESRGGELRVSSHLYLTVAGSAAADMLPPAGARVEIAGELQYEADWPLARPRLRCKSPRLVVLLPGHSALDRLRQGAVERLHLAAGVDPARIRAAGLAAALVLGRREALGSGDLERFRRGGLAHLLAVSGLHVGMVAGVAWVVLSLLGVPPYWRRWTVVVVLVAFAGLAGGAAPVRRAALAGVIYLVARQLGRPLVPFPMVAGVIAVLLLVEPAAALEVSFQLSAVVTLILVRWAGPMAAALRWPLGRAAPVVAVAAVAQAASQPLVGKVFGSVPWLGVLANLVAVPIGFLAVTASLAVTLAAAIVGAFAAPLLSFIDGMRLILSTIGGLSTHGASAYPESVWLLAVVAGLGVASLPRWRRAWIAGVAAVAVTALGPWLIRSPRQGRGELRTLEVRTGSAVLLRWDDTAVLVDAGERPGEAVRSLRRAGVTRLDGMLVTHPDADHAGGVAAVLEALPVGRLMFPAAVASRAGIVDLRRRARALGVAEQNLVRGQRIDLGGVSLDVVWPPPVTFGDDNDRSLVAVFRVGPVRVLIPGDIEARGEYALLDVGPSALDADVLVLAHHGSATSSTPAFLRQVDPRVAIAATGSRPRYPYPSARVERRLRAAHVVLVTQRLGLDRLWWSCAGEVVVGTQPPVTVRLRRGGDG